MSFQDGFDADIFANKLDTTIKKALLVSKAVKAFVQISGKTGDGENIWDVALSIDNEKLPSGTTLEMAKACAIETLKGELDGYNPDVLEKKRLNLSPVRNRAMYLRHLIS